MPHRIDKLRAAVAELEEKLQSVDDVDESTRSLLQEVSEEIQATLHPDQPPEPSLLDQVEQLSQEFGSKHPALSGLVGNIIDALGQFGI